MSLTTLVESTQHGIKIVKTHSLGWHPMYTVDNSGAWHSFNYFVDAMREFAELVAELEQKEVDKDVT
jgi:hypothetical protein